MGDNTQNPRRLPTKLLERIVLEVGNRPADLRSIARVSRLLQSIAEPALYSTIDISSIDQMTTLVHALESRPARREYVRTCRIQSVPGGEETAEAREWLACNVYANLAACDNISDLSIVSDALLESEDACGDGEPQEEQDVLEAFLFKASVCAPPEHTAWTCLTSLTLHYLATPSQASLMPGERWAFPDTSFLFLNPTLRTITLQDCMFADTNGLALVERDVAASSSSGESDVSFEAPGGTGNSRSPPSGNINPEYVHSTPLETLRLFNCSVTLRSLRAFLSTPRALKHLVLGEGADARRRGFEAALATYVARDVNEWATQVFSHQAHALERLELLAPSDDLEFRGAKNVLDLRGMEKLRELRRVVVDGDGESDSDGATGGETMKVLTRPEVEVVEVPPPLPTRAPMLLQDMSVAWEKLLESFAFTGLDGSGVSEMVTNEEDDSDWDNL